MLVYFFDLSDLFKINKSFKINARFLYTIDVF